MHWLPKRRILRLDDCPGSGQPPVQDTRKNYGPGSFYPEGGQCVICGLNEAITIVEGVMVRHRPRKGK
mgnify:CR=1 FL=1